MAQLSPPRVSVYLGTLAGGGAVTPLSQDALSTTPVSKCIPDMGCSFEDSLQVLRTLSEHLQGDITAKCSSGGVSLSYIMATCWKRQKRAESLI